MFSKVEELMFCQELWQMLLLLENVLLGFQIYLQKDNISDVVPSYAIVLWFAKQVCYLKIGVNLIIQT